MSTFLTNTFKTLRPWSATKVGHIYDLKIKAAVGSHFITNDNEKIIDFTSGQMVSNLGYNNTNINKKINKHIENGLLYSPYAFLTKEREKLSERLSDITPVNNGKVFYTTGGGESNETASYIAKSYFKDIPEKNRILTFKKSFHGASSYLSSYLSGDDRLEEKRKLYDNKKEQNAIMENPSVYDYGDSSLKQIKQLFKNENKTIAAILIEGSSGTMGCLTYPSGYYDKLTDEAKKHNILVIADEVMSGFGRTGEMFAVDKYKNKPDMMTMAKGLTNGIVPMGAVVISEELCHQYEYKPIINGLTYSGHNLSCMVANACLDEYENDGYAILDKVKLNEQIIIKHLNYIIVRFPTFVSGYRGSGQLFCIEFKNEDVAKHITEQLLKSNIYCFYRRNHLFISPPLIITPHELNSTLETFRFIFTSYLINLSRT